MLYTWEINDFWIINHFNLSTFYSSVFFFRYEKVHSKKCSTNQWMCFFFVISGCSRNRTQMCKAFWIGKIILLNLFDIFRVYNRIVDKLKFLVLFVEEPYWLFSTYNAWHWFMCYDVIQTKCHQDYTDRKYMTVCLFHNFLSEQVRHSTAEYGFDCS